MAKDYDAYDTVGRKIGELRERPSLGAVSVVVAVCLLFPFVLLWLVCVPIFRVMYRGGEEDVRPHFGLLLALIGIGMVLSGIESFGGLLLMVGLALAVEKWLDRAMERFFAFPLGNRRWP